MAITGMRKSSSAESRRAWRRVSCLQIEAAGATSICQILRQPVSPEGGEECSNVGVVELVMAQSPENRRDPDQSALCTKQLTQCREKSSVIWRVFVGQNIRGSFIRI